MIACLWILATLRPWLGLTFVAAGAIPYYTALDLLGQPTSPVLTGLVLGGTGAVGLMALVVKRRELGFDPRALVLFACFVGVWYLRWYQDPPGAVGPDGSAYFAQRAMAFMVAFAVIPFVGAQMARDPADYRLALRGLAVWGGLGILIMGAYWIAGRPSLAPYWSSKWEPIPSLSGIMLSFDVGTGCLAILATAPTRPRRGWSVAIWVVAASAVAICVRVGQRGPFLFLLLGLLVFFFLRSPRNRWRNLLAAFAGLAIVTLSAVRTSEDYNAPRAVTADNYSVDANLNRLELLSGALRFSWERPLLGWGGSLVGRRFQGETWEYSHVSLLDPLVETGLVGSLPFWLLYLLAAANLYRGLRAPPRSRDLVIRLLPLLVFVTLESQVSGHVASAKHLWFLTGLLIALPRVWTTHAAGGVPLKDRHREGRSGRAQWASL